VSLWSHNFRPAYLRLKDVLDDVVRPRCVLALTATATRDTVESVRTLLDLPADGVKLGRWRRARDNVALMVCKTPDRYVVCVCATTCRAGAVSVGALPLIAIALGLQLWLSGRPARVTVHGEHRLDHCVRPWLASYAIAWIAAHLPSIVVSYVTFQRDATSLAEYLREHGVVRLVRIHP